jgi:hypothetical protein
MRVHDQNDPHHPHPGRGVAVLSLAFGLWYSLGALHAVPYVF